MSESGLYVETEDFRTATLKWYTNNLALTLAEASDTMLEGAIRRAMDLIEDTTGDTFLTEEETLTVSGDGTSILRLSKRIGSIDEVAISLADGTQAIVSEDDYVVHASLDEEGTRRTSDIDYLATGFGRILYSGRTTWPDGFKNVSVTGVFGWAEVPEAIKRACALIVYDLLKPRNNDLLRRAESYQTDDAAFTVSRTQPTGMPEVDSILEEYLYKGAA